MALLLLSLRLLLRKIHLPRQREARIVLTPTFKIEPIKTRKTKAPKPYGGWHGKAVAGG